MPDVLAVSVVSPPLTASPFVAPDTTDQQLLDLWLHGKSPHTQRAYRADAKRFFSYVARPLRIVTLGDLQAFADHLAGATRTRALASVKSLLAFAQRIGYLPVNVGAILKLHTPKDTLGERILDEASVHKLLALEPHPRNRMLLRLLYRAGLRVSEIAGLAWRDLHARDDGGGQVTVFGKRSKTRTVLLPADIWRDLAALRNGADLDTPVFPSRNSGGYLHPTSIGAHRLGRGHARRSGRQRQGQGVAPLAPSRPRHPRPRARRADPPGPGHPRLRLGRHDRPLPPRPSHRQLGTLHGRLTRDPCPSAPKCSSATGTASRCANWLRLNSPTPHPNNARHCPLFENGSVYTSDS
jgi:integrase/recombinase XerD